MSTQSAQMHEATAAEAAWSVKRWVLANAAALGATFGLVGLFGGTVEALGAEHDSLARDLSLLAAFIIGGSLFAFLRQRALLPQAARARRVSVAAILGLAAGFIGGFVVAGPPIDFVLGIFAVGTVAGVVEWRILRLHLRRPGRLSAVTAAGWLAAAVVAVVPAVLFGDAIDAAFGSGTAGFTANLLLIGLTGGAVGGALEALALRARVARSAV